MDQLIPLIVFLPIAGFAFTALFGRRLQHAYGKPAASIVPVGLVVVTWLIASAVAFTALTGGFGESGASVTLWNWIPAGDFSIDVGFRVDQLTACLLIVVTTIGMLVHVYSIGYMAHDGGYWRFFAYLNLFMFSMLLLVLADNFLVVFAGWELVGFCSYALIGFWYRRRSAALGAKKAFLVNRVGDVGFALGLAAIWVNTGTLNIHDSLERLGQLNTTNHGLVVLIALLVFCGAAGKSAQFPLHVWLPDAMEGPTPVSALIHAATMVAAGVYLVARFFPVFAESDEAITTVAAIGAITAIIASLLGIMATDIKRVMAYSTISQLGYMMMGLGVFGIVAAIFHLFTHAFFKALLFLGAGSVNHATGTFDMRRMGGLAKYMPVTFWTVFIASMALVGVFPLAGFWSKDEILSDAWDDRPWVFVVALIGVFLTAVYVGRMLFLTFGGEYKGGEEPEHGDAGGHSEPHESPALMLAPLVVLAVMAAVAGFVNIDDGLETLIEDWLPKEK